MFRRPSKKSNLKRKHTKDLSKKFRISLTKLRFKRSNKNKKRIFDNKVIMNNNLNSKTKSSSFVSKKPLSNIINPPSNEISIRKRHNYDKTKIFVRGKQVDISTNVNIKYSKNLKILKPLTKSKIIPVIKTSPTGNILERTQVSYKVKGGVNVKKRTKL